MLLTPARDICNVLGIGVAVNVKTCIELLNDFKYSFCETPKCCSSSIMSRDKLLNLIFLDSKACVPIIICVSPVSISSFITALSLDFINLDNSLILIGNPLNLSLKFFTCCLTKSVVGAIKATWKPDIAAINDARRAISVLPYPTSPHINLSIRPPDFRSFSTSLMAEIWSSVGVNKNLEQKLSYSS